MNLGTRIKIRLEELGWERKELLDRVPELSSQSLSALIRRDSRRSELDFRIATALGVTVPWLNDGILPKLCTPFPAEPAEACVGDHNGSRADSVANFVTKVTVATAAKAETLDFPKIHTALEMLCEAFGTSLKEVFENAPKERRSSVRVHTPAVPKKSRPRKAGGTLSS